MKCCIFIKFCICFNTNNLCVIQTGVFQLVRSNNGILFIDSHHIIIWYEKAKYFSEIDNN